MMMMMKTTTIMVLLAADDGDDDDNCGGGGGAHRCLVTVAYLAMECLRNSGQHLNSRKVLIKCVPHFKETI